jgi:hypothetical protein
VNVGDGELVMCAPACSTSCRCSGCPQSKRCRHERRHQALPRRLPKADLDELAARLANTRWPDELPEAGWDYGIPRDYLQDLAEYWRVQYG